MVGNPISKQLNALDGYIHKVTDDGSPVKMRVSKQTETRRFKSWFSGRKAASEELIGKK